MSLQFLSGHDNIQEIRTDPLDYHRLSVIHFAHTECSRVFRDYAINYLDPNSQTLLSTLNPTVSVASLLRLYSLKLKEKNRSQSKTTKDSTDFIFKGIDLRHRGAKRAI